MGFLPLRHRWRAVIVGQESGSRRPLVFVTFRHERQARAWCERNNADLGKWADLARYLARYEWERIK